MVTQRFEQDASNHLLRAVKEGMAVLDRDGQRIGTVDDLYFGAVSAEADDRGQGAATAVQPNLRSDSLVENVARAVFDTNDNLPDELRERLERSGYIRMGGGLLIGRARYILPEQIAGVSDGSVRLRITRDELING